MEAREFIYQSKLSNWDWISHKNKLWQAAQTIQRYDQLAVLAQEVGLDWDHTTDLINNFYSPALEEAMVKMPRFLAFVCWMNNIRFNSKKRLRHPWFYITKVT